jgi:hypothetical protein
MFLPLTQYHKVIKYDELDNVIIIATFNNMILCENVVKENLKKFFQSYT